MTDKIDLSRIVLGGGSFSNLPQKKFVNLLGVAQSLAIYMIDTAPSYGNSEQLIGLTLQGDNRWRISTKVRTENSEVLERDGVMKSIERSLSHLKRDKISCLYIHSMAPEMVSDSALDALMELRQNGVVERIGVSSENEQLLRYFSLGVFDSFMFSLNLLDQSNLVAYNQMILDSTIEMSFKRVLANGVWRTDLKSKLLRIYDEKKKVINPNDVQSYFFRQEKLTHLGKSGVLHGSNFLEFAFSVCKNSRILVGTTQESHLKHARSIERLNPDNTWVEKVKKEWIEANAFGWTAQT
jgi:aryl-alcohol dehydrogenase-like predicted oxidoreductase